MSIESEEHVHATAQIEVPLPKGVAVSMAWRRDEGQDTSYLVCIVFAEDETQIAARSAVYEAAYRIAREAGVE